MEEEGQGRRGFDQTNKRMLFAELHDVMRTQLFLHLQEALESKDEAGEATIRQAIRSLARLRVCLEGITLLPK